MTHDQYETEHCLKYSIALAMSLPAQVLHGMSELGLSATELLQPQSWMHGRPQAAAKLAITHVTVTDCLLCRALPHD